MLACFDMDGTLLDCETFDVLAREARLEAEVSYITTEAMNGRMDFEEALRKRIELLRGLELSTVQGVVNSLPLMPGAAELIAELKYRGFVTGIITGGFDFVAESVAKRLGLDFYLANSLNSESGAINGLKEIKVNGNKDYLVKVLKERHGSKFVLAAGDGANDIPMLKAADMGIAFCPKPVVAAQIGRVIYERNLLGVLEHLNSYESLKSC